VITAHADKISSRRAGAERGSDDLHNGSSPYARRAPAVNKVADGLQVYLDFGRTARGLARGMKAAVRHFRDTPPANVNEWRYAAPL
jgi:hypothetical protein